MFSGSACIFGGRIWDVIQNRRVKYYRDISYDSYLLKSRKKMTLKSRLTVQVAREATYHLFIFDELGTGYPDVTYHVQSP